MTDEVLIVGNGISRLTHDRFIKEWRGELWGCNKVYIEYGAHLTRLNGHTDVMYEAIEYRDEHGYRYEIWAGHLGKNLIDEAKTFTCPFEFCRDSGSTWVAQALHEGRSRILVCGFDLGGYDIHSPEVVRTNKTNWVKRWRAIAGRYTLERVEFVGYDHKPFILSGRHAATYWKHCSRGRAHIDDPEYLALVENLYGVKAERPREDRVVMVKYIRGPKRGWETEYRESVADILVGRGEVEIVKDGTEPEVVDELGKTENPAPPRPKANRSRSRKKTIDTARASRMVDDAHETMVEEA